MSTRKLTPAQIHRINNLLDPHVYDALDRLMREKMKVDPEPDPATARAYRIPEIAGGNGYRVNAIGAVRRLERIGVNWREELGMKSDRSK